MDKETKEELLMLYKTLEGLNKMIKLLSDQINSLNRRTESLEEGHVACD